MLCNVLCAMSTKSFSEFAQTCSQTLCSLHMPRPANFVWSRSTGQRAPRDCAEWLLLGERLFWVAITQSSCNPASTLAARSSGNSKLHHSLRSPSNHLKSTHQETGLSKKQKGYFPASMGQELQMFTGAIWNKWLPQNSGRVHLFYVLPWAWAKRQAQHRFWPLLEKILSDQTFEKMPVTQNARTEPQSELYSRHGSCLAQHEQVWEYDWQGRQRPSCQRRAGMSTCLTQTGSNKSNTGMFLTRTGRYERKTVRSDLQGQAWEEDGHICDQDGQTWEREGHRKERQAWEQDGHMPGFDGQVWEQDGHMSEQDGQVREKDGHMSDTDGTKRDRYESKTVTSDLQGRASQQDGHISDKDGQTWEREDNRIDRQAWEQDGHMW